MKSQVAIFCLLVCCLGIGITIIFSQMDDSAPENSAIGPQLTVDASVFDFGTVIPGETISHKFEIRNTGSEPLEISDLQTSCGCTPASLSSSKLASGQVAYLSVSHQVPYHAGTIDHSITFRTNDASHENVRLRIAGLSRWPVEADPKTLHLSRIPFGKESATELEIYATNDKTLEIRSVNSSADWIDIDLIKRQKHRARYRITVQPPEAGTVKESIEIKTSCVERPTLIIPLKGEVVTGVSYSPKILLIGRRAQGESLHAKIVIKALNETPAVESIALSAEGWSITDWAETKSKPKTTELDIELTLPATPGQASAELQLMFVDKKEAAITIPILGVIR